MSEYVLRITAGTPTRGHWCETCLLPSRFEVPMYVMGEDGPSLIGTASTCDNCTPEGE